MNHSNRVILQESALSQYSKYNTEVQVEKLDKVHDEVLREFRFSEVVSKLISKFYELVNSNKEAKF